MLQPIGSAALRVTDKAASKFRPRKDRDQERADWAGEAVRRDGGSAMDVALAKVGAISLHNPAHLTNILKMHIDGILERGAADYGVRSRFYSRVRKLRGFTITEAIWAVEYWLAQEQRKFDDASKIGAASRLPIMVLTELRLILRLARFKKWDFKFWVDALLDGQMLEAAE